MNRIYLYFVNKLFLVGRYWDFKRYTFFHSISQKTLAKKEEENTGIHHFLLFPPFFQIHFLLGQQGLGSGNDTIPTFNNSDNEAF